MAFKCVFYSQLHVSIEQKHLNEYSNLTNTSMGFKQQARDYKTWMETKPISKSIF